MCRFLDSKAAKIATLGSRKWRPCPSILALLIPSEERPARMTPPPRRLVNFLTRSPLTLCPAHTQYAFDPKSAPRESDLAMPDDSPSNGPNMPIGLLVAGSEMVSFTVVGLLIDYALGTMPGFTIGLTLLGLVAAFVHLTR